MRSDRAFSMQL